MFTGVYDLPWWGYVVYTLVMTHVTIAGVTIYLHRHQAHRALDLLFHRAGDLPAGLWRALGNQPFRGRARGARYRRDPARACDNLIHHT